MKIRSVLLKSIVVLAYMHAENSTIAMEEAVSDATFAGTPSLVDDEECNQGDVSSEQVPNHTRKEKGKDKVRDEEEKEHKTSELMPKLHTQIGHAGIELLQSQICGSEAALLGDIIDPLGSPSSLYQGNYTSDPFAPTGQQELSYPPPLERFAGRQEILELLSDRLTVRHNKQTAVVVLTGPSGIGKSELAKYYAFNQQYRAGYNLIYWIQADSETNLLFSYLDLAKILDIPLQDGLTLDSLRTSVHSALEKRSQWLLVFDNAEEQLVLPEKNGSVIVTSQKEDIWDAKRLIQLFPLTDEEVTEFLQMEMEQENLESVKALAQRCQGIPLLLSQIIGLIRQSDNTVADLLKQTEEKEQTTQQGSFAIICSLIFDQIQKQNPKAFEILLSCSFLHPENISVSWIQDLLGQEYNMPPVQADKDAVAFLKGYNLIRLDKQRDVFSLHRLLHKALQEYACHQREYVYNRVLVLLDKQKSIFDKDKIETWRDAKLWSVHAEFFLAQQQSDAKNDAIYLRLLSTIGSISKELGDFKKALTYYQQALEMTQNIFEEEINADVATALNNIGSILYAKGKYKEALEYHRRALQMRQKMYGEDAHPHVAVSLNNIGNALNAQAYYEDALGYYYQALEMYKKLFGQEPSTGAVFNLNNIGAALYAQGKYEDALGYYHQALEMYRKLFGQGTYPAVAGSFNNIANALKAQGKYEAAFDYHYQALEMYKTIYGQRMHPAVAASLVSMGTTLKAQGKYDQAWDYYNQALVMYKKIYGEDAHPAVEATLNNIGLVLESQGKYDQAAKYYQKTLLMERQLNSRHPSPAIAAYIRKTEQNIARVNANSKRKCFIQ